MEIKLYNNVSDNNVISKVLNNETAVNGHFRKQFDLDYPTINVNGVVALNEKFNYCFIPDINKYYYVNSVKWQGGDNYELSLSIDVLKTFEDEIKSLYGVVSKSEHGNKYLHRYKTEVRENITKIDFENNFNENGNFVFITKRG